MADRPAVSVYVHRECGTDGVAEVADHVARRGLSVTATQPSRCCLIVRGDAAGLTAVFGPPAHVVATRIEAVLGLPGKDEGIPQPAVAATDVTGMTPAAISEARGLAPGDGAGHCIGVLSFGGAVDHATFVTACAHFGIEPPAQHPHLISIDAAAPAAAAAADGPLLPVLLLLAALVPKARVVVYFAPPSTRGWVDAVSAAVHDHDNKPSVLCSPWMAPAPEVMRDTLASQAAELLVALYLPSAAHADVQLASGIAGRGWSGGGIEMALQAAAHLRAVPAASVGVSAGAQAAAPPPRPYFDAVTTSARPLAAAHRAVVAYETDRIPGPAGDKALPVGWWLLPGSMARDIAAGGDGSVWALGNVSVGHLTAGQDFALFRWTGFAWAPAPAAGTAVAADARGCPWLVDAQGTLLRFTGTDWRIEGRDISDVALAHDGTVWALSRARTPQGHAVLHRDATGGDWSETDARGERIAVAPDGTPWIVTIAGDALARDAEDGGWTRQATNARDVAFGPAGDVWVVTRRGQRICRRDCGAETWRRAEGVADRLALPRAGEIWAITQTNCVAVGRLFEETAA